MIQKIIYGFILSLIMVACSTNPLTGKSQLTILPESELQSMATQQYQQFLTTNRVVSSSNNRDADMVKRVGQRISRAVESYYSERGLTNKLDGI